MVYPEIEITKDDLKKIIYFILMKFKGDQLHRQGTSAKRDLIGGYIERWFNKIAETVIFDNLLNKKDYEAVSDYFIYSDDKKNVPDILGLKKLKKILPFVKYNNGTWDTISGMPRIEVKVFRKDQALVSIREPQMIDDYYVIIDSDLNGDYLTAIFRDEVFEDKFFNSLIVDDVFIESDIDNNMIEHMKVMPAKKIGTMRLIGIYTKKEFKDNSILCRKGVSPYYFGWASNKILASKLRLNEKLNLDKMGRFVYKYNSSYVCLPVAIDSPKNNKITVLKRNKGSVYINSLENISIGGIKLKAGDICVEFKKFDRSSKWDENVLLKQTLEKYGKDSTKDLIDLFDELVSK